MHDEKPDQSPAALDEETTLRGTDLGSERIEAADHLEHAQKRNPDLELRLDGGKDSLYSDGLDIDNSGGPLAGTDGFKDQ